MSPGCESIIKLYSQINYRYYFLKRKSLIFVNKKHLKNVGPIRHCEPAYAHSPEVASGTVARRLHIHVHDIDNNDNT